MKTRTLAPLTIAAMMSVWPVALAAENTISPGRTWADAEGCNVLSGNWSGQAYTILTREEIRFWETTCVINETQYAGGQSLNVMTTCQGFDDPYENEFQFAARVDGSARLYHEESDWEVFLNGC